MIVLDGQSALSPFRLERLNGELARIAPGSSVSAAWYVYFVSVGDTAPIDRERLLAVLRAERDGPRRARLRVVPRLGTISPWSSKATDILRGCGFASDRVERGIAFDIARA